MIALMVVVTDERIDLRFKVSGQEVVFQQDAVLQRLMPALNFTLGLRVIRCAGNSGSRKPTAWPPTKVIRSPPSNEFTGPPAQTCSVGMGKTGRVMPRG